jgi:predicted nicotinamide N-methyase
MATDICSVLKTTKMKKTLFTLSFLLAVAFAFAGIKGNSENTDKSTESVSANTSVSISGKVIDFTSGEALVGVEVAIEGSTKKAHTDLDGNFKIDNIKPGSYNLIASYISYNKSLIEKLDIDKSNKELNIKLQSAN